MRFDIVTIFPEYFTGPLDYGVLRRARETGRIIVRVQDLREFTEDRHRTVDDRPFGGGAGMVLKPEPLFAAVEKLRGQAKAAKPALEALAGSSRGKGRQPGGCRPAPGAGSGPVILLSAQGRVFTQADALRLAGMEHIILLCGRYEGVDERVATSLSDEELSVGDYVLSGGEPAAALVVDSVARLLPGVLGNEASALEESFRPDSSEGMGLGILDYPHYTRPAVFRGLAAPEVLLSGHHEQVRRWRRKSALEKTLHHRPELLERAPLGAGDRELLAEIMEERRAR